MEMLKTPIDDIINNHIALRLCNGEKAYIAYNRIESSYSTLYGLRISPTGRVYFLTWSTDGKWNGSDSSEHDYNIVGLWESE